MSKVEHKEIKVLSSIRKNMGYGPEENYFSVGKSDDRDTFISTVRAKAWGDKIKVNILFEGKPEDAPEELLEKLLCTGDSSYNPMRPFRWYKDRNSGGSTICADTNDPESIKKCRDESFGSYLNEIDNPEKVFIYEIE